MKKHHPKKRHRRRKCLHCNELYFPDYRNLRHQRYCSKPQCRAASKKASQQKYLASDKGCGYFTGEINVKRVQDWRKSHPQYWNRQPKKTSEALQDDCSSQRTINQSDMGKLKNNALQDICSSQLPFLLGLISTLTGTALQDDIAEISRRFINLGHDILGDVP